uniref:Cyclin N-terminal domain-containing protein n=1 Tax=Angiostrongylus cantonensis TaxID=6313 RepID=A0A0K0CWI1_ANGCA
MDYRSDWICELALENSGRIMSASEYDNDYLTLESVQYIFTVCVRLRLPHDIRYLAVLIFARFMRIHSVQVFGFLGSLKLSEKRRLHEWEKVEANLSRQTTLRMLSSIQIASKALSYHDVSFWASFLAAALGKVAVVELIFKTRCFWPDVDYKSIWEHILLFLDMVFLHHDQVYEVVLKEAVAINNTSLPRKVNAYLGQLLNCRSFRTVSNSE